MSKSNRSTIRAFVAGALDHIQTKVTDAASIEELIRELITKLPFKDELSIIYQGYGDTQPRTIIANGRSLSDEEGTNHELANHDWVMTAISSTGLSQGVQNPTAQAVAADSFFKQYKTVAVVPMRLSKTKNIGAFIVHQDDDNNFDKEDIKSLDKLADRVAYFIQNNIRRRRNKTFLRFHNSALAKVHLSEKEILEDVFTYLKEWYQQDKIYILIRDPLNTNKYFTAANKNGVIENFRKETHAEDLKTIAGNTEVLRKHLKISFGLLLKRTQRGFEGSYKNKSNEKIPIQLAGDIFGETCQSWMGATMHLGDRSSVGHIILQSEASDAYQFEDEDFLDSMADFTALLLGRYREKQKYNIIDKITDFQFGESQGHTTENLYQLVFEQLHDFYGISNLQIALFNRTNMQLESVFCEGDFPKISEKQLTSLNRFVLKKGASPSQTLTSASKELTVRYQGVHYLIVPMRIKRQARILGSYAEREQITHRAIGCYIIPAAKIGVVTAEIIDDLSDAFAEKINTNQTQSRNNTIIQMGQQVANLRSSNLTQKGIFELAYDLVAEAMFSENFYVALYNKENNFVSFPLIKKDGHTWSIEARPINIEKLGKTEEIILTKKPLLHYSRAESEAWYQYPKHTEHGGDALASWIGVPIFLNTDVIGVIAAYHPRLNWVYTTQDQFFLESVSSQISGLFRVLRLGESNKKQAEAIELIKEQEESGNKEILDLLNNQSHPKLDKLEEILIYIKDDIKKAITENNTDTLKDFDALYNRANSTMIDIKEELSEIVKNTDNKNENVDLYSEFKRLLNIAKNENITIRQEETRKISINTNKKYIQRALNEIIYLIKKISISEKTSISFSLQKTEGSVVLTIEVNSLNISNYNYVKYIEKTKKIIEIILNGKCKHELPNKESSTQLTIKLVFPDQSNSIALFFSDENITLKKKILKTLQSLKDPSAIIEASSTEDLQNITKEDILLTDEKSYYECTNITTNKFLFENDNYKVNNDSISEILILESEVSEHMIKTILEENP